MSKSVQLVLLVVVSLASFLIGVKYSEQVKSNVSWMSESKDEVALPDLTNEEIEGAATSTEGEASSSEAAAEKTSEAAKQ